MNKSEYSTTSFSPKTSTYNFEQKKFERKNIVENWGHNEAGTGDASRSHTALHSLVCTLRRRLTNSIIWLWVLLICQPRHVLGRPRRGLGRHYGIAIRNRRRGGKRWQTKSVATAVRRRVFDGSDRGPGRVQRRQPKWPRKCFIEKIENQ